MDFLTKLRAAQAKNNSLLCVGLDPDFDKLPAKFQNSTTPLADFNMAIIDGTGDIVCAYKPNSAFYEARGAEGIEDLKRTCDYLHEKYPDIPIILDFKRGDIGNTNEYYAQFAFEYLGVDAVTVQPYVGKDALEAFLNYEKKGVIVLCKTSNEGSGEFQDLETGDKKLYISVAQNVQANWNSKGNCLLVVGATHSKELAEVRKTVGNDMYILVPGIGSQGGDLRLVLEAGGENLIINSSRAILYADNPSQAAASLSQAINQFRTKS